MIHKHISKQKLFIFSFAIFSQWSLFTINIILTQAYEAQLKALNDTSIKLQPLLTCPSLLKFFALTFNCNASLKLPIELISDHLPPDWLKILLYYSTVYSWILILRDCFEETLFFFKLSLYWERVFPFSNWLLL